MIKQRTSHSPALAAQIMGDLPSLSRTSGDTPPLLSSFRSRRAWLEVAPEEESEVTEDEEAPRSVEGG